MKIHASGGNGGGGNRGAGTPGRPNIFERIRRGAGNLIRRVFNRGAGN